MSDRNEAYVNKVLDGLLTAPEGQRNDTLVKAAFTFGGLVASGLISRKDAETKLELCASAIDPGDIKQSQTTIQSGLNAGMLHPLDLDMGPTSSLTDEQKAEIAKQRQEIVVQKKQKRQDALKKLQLSRPDIIYQKNLNGQAKYLKSHWGLNDSAIENFNLGYCQACPTSPYSDSFTIPYYWRESLINLRHRLLQPNGSGKYRPEAAGLPSAIFNADLLSDCSKDDFIIIVEGEFKAMVLWQQGFMAVAIPGATIFKEKWVKLFNKVGSVYIALDPGAATQAARIGNMLKAGKVRASIVTLPTKPDDFFVVYGGNARDFSRFLEMGRIV